MLPHNLAPSSTALLFGSNHRKEDVLCEWMLAKTWKSFSEYNRCSQDGSHLLTTSDSYAIPDSNGMFKRRKLREESVIFPPVELETKGPTGSVKSVPAKANSGYEIDVGVRRAITTPGKCNKGIRSINESVDSELVSKGLDKENNYSALKLEMGASSTTVRIEASNIVEHSNTELAVSGEDLCISILRSDGLLNGDCPETSGASNKLPGNTKDGNTLESCKLCGNLDDTLNMLICDHCEEAFHVSCCNLKPRMLPTDEWFCESCSKLDGKVSLEASFLKSKNISCLRGKPKFKSGPITLMLKWPGPYISRVRIGVSFQAAVPEWPDQVPEDFDCIGEPLEMKPAQTIGSNGCPKDGDLKHNSVSNWLQCREVLRGHTSEFIEGTICGKWRRAPLSEIQTDKWDCSCAVLWDPSHADCAVPQELETDRVLLQLTYIEQLRSRFDLRKCTNSVVRKGWLY